MKPFSPRMWGCTYDIRVRCRHQQVFPTHVGVYLTIQWESRVHRRFPHACGGVPSTIPSASLPSFVFPTHVGVYLSFQRAGRQRFRFPHACGGVPSFVPVISSVLKFSPRMWGCT